MDNGRTDGRRLVGYTISSPCEPNGSGELKSVKNYPVCNDLICSCEKTDMWSCEIQVSSMS